MSAKAAAGAEPPTEDPVVPVDPVVRVVRGAPDDDELAAVVAVLRARADAAAAASGPRGTRTANGWADYWRTIGAAPTPGPGTWTAAARR